MSQLPPGDLRRLAAGQREGQSEAKNIERAAGAYQDRALRNALELATSRRINGDLQARLNRCF